MTGYCAAGICVALKAKAASCKADTECASQKCLGGACAVYSAAAAMWCGEVLSP